MKNEPVHNSILVTDYLTKMGIKTVPQPSSNSELAPCYFWLFPKLRGCCFETIDEMKQAVTKGVDTLKQEAFHGVFQKLYERYNKCIAVGGDHLEEIHNSILVTDYLTKMGIKTVPQPSSNSELAPCDFWLFPKLRGCCFETIDEMKEAVTKVVDTLKQEAFHGAFQKLYDRYNKCIAVGGDHFEGD